ncbi:MAG: hypothetical protein HKN85_07565 [Gammaproteobacteria bacterium]|nr:hypothetical protein [Gammaproteobacteria bacterium]
MSPFSFLTKIFGGDTSLTGDEQVKLFEELMFLTLSRASRSDLDISSVEVELVQRILKESAGIDATEQEIRTAGQSELYEVAPLDKYVAKASKRLTVDQRRTLVTALYDVIGVDGKVTTTEAEFFDHIANAVHLRPVELMGAQIEQGHD